MAVVKPFYCIRPDSEAAKRVAALPYDVFSRKEALLETQREPMSFLSIDRAETQFSEDVDMYDDCVYKKAAELLNQRIKEGILLSDRERAYYLYELTMDGRSQTGIAACTSIDDYRNHVIKKHEKTRADKEVDRIRHVNACDANTGPVFLAYRAQKEISSLIAEEKEQKALYDFITPDGIRHRVFKISDAQKLGRLEALFGQIESLYIADGHHRAASAVRVGLMRREQHPDYTGEEAFNYFLSVLFPDEELMIMDYNRVLKDLNGYSPEEFLAAAGQCFEVQKCGSDAVRPKKRHEFGMYLGGCWYRLTAKEAICSADPVEGLDVSILQRNLLAPVLGIQDPKTDKRIDFVGGIRGMQELERRVNEDMAVAFSLFPTSMKELFTVADAGLLMPPKSTWFEPKLRSGLFIHKLS